MLLLALLLQAATGRIDGTVTRESGAPIRGATIAVNALARRTTTDSAGRFALQVPAGSWDVIVSARGYRSASLRVDVAADRSVRLEVSLEPVPDTAGVTRARPDAARPQNLPTLSVTATTADPRPPIAPPGDLSGPLTTGLARLDREQIDAVPPTFEPDVLRALQSTAGVGGANDINAHLAVRGGAPEHTQYLLDGAPVLGPYHMFGLFGAFNPDAVDEAQILRGSLPARVGGALGSVVSLRTLRPDRFRLIGGATVLTSRLAGSGPLGGAGSWLVAGRRTNLGFGESGPFNLDVPYWFWDLQGALRLTPATDQEITLSTYGSGDKFSEDLFFVDEGTAPLFSTWRNRVGSVSWRYAPAAGWGASLALRYSGYRSTLALGDTTLRADSATTRGTTRLTGFSAAVGRPLRGGSVRLGLDVTGTRAALAGDSVAPGYLDDRVDRRITETSASVEFERAAGPVIVAPGLRVTRWSAGPAWSVEPRLALRWNVGRTSTLTASVSRTVQALHALRDDRLPILGVPFWSLPDSLAPRAGATAFEVMIAGEPVPGWTVEASAFHRRLSGLPRWRPTGTRDLSQLAYDEGTASGLELSVARRTGTVTGWASYTPLVATIRQPDGTTYRPLWDRRHAFDAVLQLKLGGFGLVSQRVTFSTGQPFWVEQGMFTGSEFDAVTGTARFRSDAAFPVWSETQGTLPAYFRADLTVSSAWQVGGLRVAPFAGLINLTGRRNVTGYRAQPGGLQNTIEYLPRKQLPRVPVLGVDISIGTAGPR